jgi:hypothetical protein
MRRFYRPRPRDLPGPGGESVLDLAGSRKPAGLFLGKDQLAVGDDLEDPSRPLHQLGLEAEPLLQLVRQTGGAGQVISGRAVSDDDLFWHG